MDSEPHPLPSLPGGGRVWMRHMAPCKGEGKKEQQAISLGPRWLKEKMFLGLPHLCILQ